jgi:signal transduction histidine kinase
MQTNKDLDREMVERKRLETEVIRVSEEHQKTIGQELHDGLGQYLTGIAILSMTLQQRLCAMSLPEAGAAQEIVELINQAISMTHSLARGLYPAALESGGLTAALEQLAGYTTSVIGIECTLRCDPQVRVNDKLVAINLYRIAQEAINNAVKYSKAKHIWLDFSIVDEKYRFSISDDGIGFDPKA